MAAFQPSFPSLMDPNFKVTAPGITTSLAATVTDTGIRLRVLGDLTICTIGTSESIGIVCRSCNGLSTNFRPWTRCPTCEEFLWEAAAPPLPPRAFRLDYTTGQLVEELRRKATKSGTPEETPESPAAAPGPIAAASSPTKCNASPKTSRGYGRGQLNRLIHESPYRVGGIRDESAGSGKTLGEGVPTRTVTVRTTCTTTPVTTAETVVATTTVTTSTARSPTTVPAGGFVKGLVATTSEGARNSERSCREGNSSAGNPNVSAAEEVKPWVLKFHDTQPAPDLANFDFGDPNSDPEEIYVESVIPQSSRGASNWPECSLRDRRDAAAVNAIKSPETPVLPGCGDPKKLPKLARAHRVIQKKVARDYGFQYPYAPQWVLDEVEDYRNGWIADAIWDYLGIPESNRGPGLTPQIGIKFDECLMNWNYGRHIYCDQVVIKRPGRKDSVYFVTTVDREGYSVTLPDPQFYW